MVYWRRKSKKREKIEETAFIEEWKKDYVIPFIKSLPSKQHELFNFEVIKGSYKTTNTYTDTREKTLGNKSKIP